MELSRPARSRWPAETLAFLGLGTLAAGLGVFADIAGTPAGLLIVLAAGVALAGLPHGALDPWIARRARLWTGLPGFALFNLAYLSLALAFAGFWLVLPGLALCTFLLVSAWHFGGDWFGDGRALSRALAGLALLGLPAFFHPAIVGDLFKILSGRQGQLIAEALAFAGPVIAAAAAGVILAQLPRSPRISAELAALAAFAGLLHPLVYFVVYFCVLHSPRHLLGSFAEAPPRLRGRLARLAVGYTAITLLGAALLWPVLSQAGAQSGLLRLVFIGLAALTIPHLVLVECSRARRANRP